MKKSNSNDHYAEEDSDWRSKQQPAKRCLEIFISNGVNSFRAVEKQTLDNLKLPIPYGLKIHIIGTIKIRRGIIFLKPQNLSILGGSIETENIEVKRLETRLTDLGRIPPKRNTHYEGKLSEIASKDQPKKKIRQSDIKSKSLSSEDRSKSTDTRTSHSNPVQKSITNFLKPKLPAKKDELSDDFSDDDDFNALISQSSNSSDMIVETKPGKINPQSEPLQGTKQTSNLVDLSINSNTRKLGREPSIKEEIVILSDDSWDEMDICSVPKKNKVHKHLENVTFLINFTSDLREITIMGFIQSVTSNITPASEGYQVGVRVSGIFSRNRF